MRGDQERVLADVQFLPGCSGSTTSSPGAFLENAMCPGPLATVMMCGMPAMERFSPPPVFIDESGTVSSFHSSTWCSK